MTNLHKLINAIDDDNAEQLVEILNNLKGDVAVQYILELILSFNGGIGSAKKINDMIQKMKLPTKTYRVIAQYINTDYNLLTDPISNQFRETLYLPKNRLGFPTGVVQVKELKNEHIEVLQKWEQEARELPGVIGTYIEVIL